MSNFLYTSAVFRGMQYPTGSAARNENNLFKEKRCNSTSSRVVRRTALLWPAGQNANEEVDFQTCADDLVVIVKETFLEQIAGIPTGNSEYTTHVLGS